MVALNFQTPDLGMQLNHVSRNNPLDFHWFIFQAKFSQYRGCGFVRKPEFMLSLVKTVKEKNEDYICPVAFNPFKKDQHSIHGIKKKYLQLHFIAGRHIFGLGRTYQSVNTSNVDYSIEIIGVDADKAKYRFKVI